MHEETFGEQVKFVLEKRGMTIKELAELIEERTDKKMSRQNLTQRLGRDNFQEQDMRLIADVLGCPFTLSILDAPQEGVCGRAPITEVHTPKRTIRYINTDALREARKAAEREKERARDGENHASPERRFIKKVETDDDPIFHKEPGTGRKPADVEEEKTPEPVVKAPDPEEDKAPPECLVRATPGKIGYVDVLHTKTGRTETMTQWAFFGREEKRKRQEGEDYVPPTIWNK